MSSSAMPNATSKKPPRRTAERILEVTLELFNRFGEPNVSTTLISAELKISPGNLYYHYPAKEELINALFGRYEKALDELLRAADGVRNVEDAWLFFHMLFELIWQYRFLYRDLNDLLSKNRKLEMHFQFVLKNKARAVAQVLVAAGRQRVYRAMLVAEVAALGGVGHSAELGQWHWRLAQQARRGPPDPSVPAL